jgi:hypothetical protein
MPLTLIARLYFLTVGLFAAFVAVVGLLFPQWIDHAIPWAVPPLHARVIGAVYLGGMVLMFGALRHPLPRVWAMLPLAAVWTGVLLMVSILHASGFNWDHWPVRFWWFAYLVFPVVGAWLTHSLPAGRSEGAPVPVALALAMLAGVLLVAPGLAARVWPWPLPPLLSQIYSGPLFGLAVGVTLVTRRALPEERRLLSLGLATLCAAVLMASLWHLPLFRPASPSTWVWFAALLFGLGGLGRSLLARRTR